MFESTNGKMREPGHSSPRDGSRYDVVILGAGPAGLLLARELAAASLTVLVVSPPRRRALKATYGLWLDEAELAGIVDCLEHVWPRATVRISDERRFVLERGYARVDGELLQEKLRAQANARGVVYLEDAADVLAHDDEGTSVRLESGGTVNARLVVDATGHSTRFVERARDERPAVQMAYGVFLANARFADEITPLDKDTAVIMDLRPFAPGEDERQPSFLYALHQGDGRALLEETSLVGTPAVPERELARRLRKRMARLGVTGREVGEEIVVIPMGRPLPSEDQRVLGFGAAAGMVHPSTGYMLGGILRRAAPLARSLARAFSENVPAAALGPTGWRALWPPERREARELQTFGMEVLRVLDGDGQRAFFEAYFTAAKDDWPALMSFDATPSEITAVMERAFHVFPLSLKVRASLLLTVRHRSLVPQLARTLIGAHHTPGALPPAP